MESKMSLQKPSARTAISDATIAFFTQKNKPAPNIKPVTAPAPQPRIDYSAHVKINRAVLADGIQCSLGMGDPVYAAKVLVAHLSGALLVTEPALAAQLGALVGIPTPATSTEV